MVQTKLDEFVVLFREVEGHKGTLGKKHTQQKQQLLLASLKNTERSGHRSPKKERKESKKGEKNASHGGGSDGGMEGGRPPHSLTEGGTDVEKGSNLEARDQHPLTVLTQF